MRKRETETETEYSILFYQHSSSFYSILSHFGLSKHADGMCTVLLALRSSYKIIKFMCYKLANI